MWRKVNLYLIYLVIILNSSGQPDPSPLVFTQQVKSGTECREVGRTLVAEAKKNLPTGVRVKLAKVRCKFIGGSV